MLQHRGNPGAMVAWERKLSGTKTEMQFFRLQEQLLSRVRVPKRRTSHGALPATAS